MSGQSEVVLAQSFESGGRTCYNSVISLYKVLEQSQPAFTSKKFVVVREQLTADINDKAIGDIASFVDQKVSDNTFWSMGTLTFAVFSDLSFAPSESFFEEQTSKATTVGQLRWIAGSEEWAPLDGFRRILGMQIALSRAAGKQRTALSNELIPVLLLPVTSFEEYWELLIRFRKTARNVDRGKTIRTSINDFYTKYAEGLMGQDVHYTGIIDASLINWKSNTLTNRLRQFSTLSVLYDSSKILDKALGPIAPNSTAKDIDKRYEKIAAIWKQLLEQFTPFSQAVNGKPDNIPTLRDRDFCLKPTGQLVVISVLAKALEIQDDILLQEIIQRMNTLPWQMQDSLWKNVIIIDGRVNGSTQAIKFTSLFIAYLIGLPLSDIDLKALKQWYRSIQGQQEAKLPERRFPLIEM